MCEYCDEPLVLSVPRSHYNLPLVLSYLDYAHDDCQFEVKFTFCDIPLVLSLSFKLYQLYCRYFRKLHVTITLLSFVSTACIV